MRRKLLVLAILCVVTALSTAAFGDTEKITAGKSELYGCFSKPCTVAPGQSNLYYNSALGGKFGTTYFFYGRTGDKTFDVRRKATGSFGEDSIYHYYFTPNETVDIDYAGGMGNGCAKDDDILLKFIELKGNRLTYQIILPNCLKNK
ncbi:MAG: hypothetical protein M0024_10575 [Nitrospiraceae bacterium]|nr:hypothetical protein [Nitrospiraceae bacterium]